MGLFDSTQNTQVKPWGPTGNLLRKGFKDLWQSYKKGPTFYEGSTVTPFSEQTKGAFGGLTSLAGANSGGNGMSRHLQDIMNRGGFNAGQAEAMTNVRGLADNAGLNTLINDANGMTGAQNNAYAGLQGTVYGNNAALQDTFNQGGLTGDQNLVADRYRGEMSSPFDINSNPAYAQVRQRALDAGAQGVTSQAAKMGRLGGAANQNILARNQSDTAATMDMGEYRNWQQRGDAAAAGLAGLSQTGFGNQLNINSAQQAGLQGIGSMGAMGVDQRNQAIGAKSGLESSLFNMNQIGLSNMAQAYQTAQQPYLAQRAVGAEYEDLFSRQKADELRKFDAANPMNHITNFLSTMYGAPKGQATTTSQSPFQTALGLGVGAVGLGGLLSNWGQTQQPATGSSGNGLW